MFCDKAMKHTGNILWMGSSFDLVVCEKCKFIHQNPLPIENNLYSSNYYETIKPHFGREHEIDKQWWKSVYKDIFDTIESYLDKRQRRILDVGAGYMGFCEYAKKRKWNPVGLDPALQSYKRAKELNIDFYRGNYDENCLHLGLFDVIHAYEVLEHIINPIEFLTQSHKQLEQNGILTLTAPNDWNSLQSSQNKRQGKENYWIVKEHINYFTIESLSKLLQNNGFDILEVRTSFPMELFLMMGIDYTKNDRTGRRVHGYRKKFELNMKKHTPELFRDWSQFWTDHNLGRDITIWARKV